MPLASRMRISLVPAPTSSNGFQSVGSSPAWTFPNWKPASFRASLGNASKSSEADPTQRICFSSSIQPACIKFYTSLRVQVKVFGERVNDARRTMISRAWAALSTENAGLAPSNAEPGLLQPRLNLGGQRLGLLALRNRPEHFQRLFGKQFETIGQIHFRTGEQLRFVRQALRGRQQEDVARRQ